MSQRAGSEGTRGTEVLIHGKSTYVEEGDVILTMWRGWAAWLMSFISGDYTHAALVVFVDGLPCVAESTRRAWRTVDNRQICAGVSVRHIGKSFDDRRLIRLAVARLDRPLTPNQGRMMRRFVLSSAAAEAQQQPSSYDCGADLVFAPVMWGTMSDDRYQCAEFLARAFDAAGRWPVGEGFATMPVTVMQRVGARIVECVV